MIRLEEVTKTFYYPAHRPGSVREWVIRKLRRQPTSPGRGYFRLSGVSLEIAAGESVGIVGDNGSGKSTLLRIMAGIYEPSGGRVRHRGRITPVLELGAGFHPQLSGLENVRISAAALGVGRSELERAMPDILSFAGIGDAIRMPIKYYSTGMRARLAFSAAVAVRPDVLILDEVLAVGDQSFQRKCLARIREIHEGGATVVYVSHALESVRSLCPRVIWIDRGRVVADGPAAAVLAKYERNQ